MALAKKVAKVMQKKGGRGKGLMGKLAYKVKKKTDNLGAKSSVRKAGAQSGRAKQAASNMMDDAGARMRSDGSRPRTMPGPGRARKARFMGRYNEDVGGRR